MAGPHTGAEDEFVGRELAVPQANCADTATLEAPSTHLRLPAEFDAGSGAAALQGVHQELRIEVAILRDVDGARDVHLDARLARCRRLGVEHFCAETKSTCLDRRPGFFCESVRVAAKDQDAAVPEVEVVTLGGESDIERAARQRE